MGSGKSSGSINLRPSPLERTQEGVAKQLFTETTPLRTGLLASLEDIFGLPRTIQPSTVEFIPKGQKGAGTPRMTPTGTELAVNPFGMFAGARENLEAQYPVARKNILSTIPNRGGQLNKNLFDLETTRSREVGGLKERVIGNALQAASGALSGNPALLSLPDRGAARQSAEAQIQMANAQAGSQKKAGTAGAIGQVLGATAGGIFGGPAGAMVGGGAGGALGKLAGR